ncbi:MAG: MarR family transcriptional regulator [Clostridia bacterium]|nr:MarR family transcriptional regulator [Clostridia bacterium]
MNRLYKEIESFMSFLKRVDLSKVFDVDLSNSEMVLLRTIDDISSKKEISSVYVSDIVDALSISAQAISKCFKGLESKGYIERFTNKNDRRRTEVRFTDYGKENYRKLIGSICDFMKDIFAGFGKEEYEQFVILIKKFRLLYENGINKLCDN